MRIQCQYDVGQYVKFKCGGNTLFGTIHMIVVKRVHFAELDKIEDFIEYHIMADGYSSIRDYHQVSELDIIRSGKYKQELLDLECQNEDW